MASNLKVFLICLIVVGIYMIFSTIKKKKLSMKYGMYWTLVGLFMLGLVIFPNIIEWLANICGFKEAPNMLFLIAIFLLFYIVFNIFTSISKLIENNKAMAQELSILKNELEKKNSKK